MSELAKDKGDPLLVTIETSLDVIPNMSKLIREYLIGLRTITVASYEPRENLAFDCLVCRHRDNHTWKEQRGLNCMGFIFSPCRCCVCFWHFLTKMIASWYCFLFCPIVLLWYCIRNCITKCECKLSSCSRKFYRCSCSEETLTSSESEDLCSIYSQNSGCTPQVRECATFRESKEGDENSSLLNQETSLKVQYKDIEETGCFCYYGCKFCEMEYVPRSIVTCV